jgi:hypothetical protein
MQQPQNIPGDGCTGNTGNNAGNIGSNAGRDGEAVAGPSHDGQPARTRCFKPPSVPPLEYDAATSASPTGGGDLSDMNFCMASYVTEAMKVRRS